MPTEQAEQLFVGDPQNPSGLLILDGEQAYFHECPTQGDMEHVTNNILPNRIKGPDVVAKRSQVPIRGDLSHNLDSQKRTQPVLHEIARLRPDFISMMLRTWSKNLRSSSSSKSWWPPLPPFDWKDSFGKLPMCYIKPTIDICSTMQSNSYHSYRLPQHGLVR
jgi:hypothetical protein